MSDPVGSKSGRRGRRLAVGLQTSAESTRPASPDLLSIDEGIERAQPEGAEDDEDDLPSAPKKIKESNTPPPAATPASTQSKGKEKKHAPPEIADDDDKNLLSSPTNTKLIESLEDVVSRLEKQGKRLSIDIEANWAMPEPFQLDELWKRLIANFLLRDPSFIRLMQYPEPPEWVHFQQAWLANVILPWRYRMYPSFFDWLMAFLSPANSKEIVRRSMKMYRDIFTNEGAVTVLGLQAIPPGTEWEDKQLRGDIFRHHTARQRIRDAIKAITDSEYHLTHKLTDSSLHSTDPIVQTRVQNTVDELHALQQTKTSLRENLATSSFFKTGRAGLDKLLGTKEAEYKCELQLWEIPASVFTRRAEATVSRPIKQEFKLEVDENFKPTVGDGSPAKSAGRFRQIMASIGLNYPFGARFYDWKVASRMHGNAVFMFMTEEETFDRPYNKPRMASHQILAPDDKVLDVDMSTIEERLEKKWQSVLDDNLDHDRLMKNLHYFENLTARPIEITSARPDSWNYRTHRERFGFLADNLVHVRSFVATLHREGLLKFDDNCEVDTKGLQQCLRRMWLLVSLVYGCCPEASFLLTTMDTLLEDLAGYVIGHEDPLVSTESMRRLHMFSEGGLPTVSNAQATDTKAEDRARVIFAELARFYRGAVLFAYCSVIWGTDFPSNPGMWYQDIVESSRACDSGKCMEYIEVRTRLKGKKTTPREVSVAVEDARFGFPQERSQNSSNRSVAYPCLARLIERFYWHPGYQLVFHYYAHPYHVGCKSFRGKESLVNSMAPFYLADE